MERFDLYAAKNGAGVSEEATSNGYNEGDSVSAVPSPPPSSSPVKRQAESEEASEPASMSPPPKKHKPDTDVDADALYAAKLQAEENLRARPTRGGNTRRAPATKKKNKAKTSKRVKAEDDSDVESGSDTKKEVKRTGGFHVRATPEIWDIEGLTSFAETTQPLASLGRTIGRADCMFTSTAHTCFGTNQLCSFHGPKRSKKYGNISGRMSSRIQVIDVKSAATMPCVRSSSRIGCTCLP